MRWGVEVNDAGKGVGEVWVGGVELGEVRVEVMGCMWVRWDWM